MPLLIPHRPIAGIAVDKRVTVNRRTIPQPREIPADLVGVRLSAPGRQRPPPSSWDPDAILAGLRDFYSRHGVAPTTGTWDGTPDVMTIANRFGGWPRAIEAAGILPAVIKKLWDDHTDDQLKALYRELARELGRPPHGNERVGRDGRYPSPAYMRFRFGAPTTRFCSSVGSR